MRNFVQFFNEENNQGWLDVFANKLKPEESKELYQVLKKLKFSFCYVGSNSILAFLQNDYSYVTLQGTVLFIRKKGF
jgi:hypothetical protein